MPGFDWVPLVSQVKTTFQLLTGDVDGAARTTENFWKECPVFSQVTSIAQVITGDADGAIETQKRCLGTVNNFANGTPVVGHVKGLVHHAVGDHKGGNRALNSATRTTVVLGSGAAAGIATGGIGAIGAGIAAGAVYDTANSAISNEPKGIIAVIDNAKENTNAGNIFDAIASVAADGLTGYSGGQMATKSVTNQSKINDLQMAREAKNAQLTEMIGTGQSGKSQALGLEINALTKQIDALSAPSKGPQYVYDMKTNKIVIENPSSGSVSIPIASQNTQQVLNRNFPIENEITLLELSSEIENEAVAFVKFQ